MIMKHITVKDLGGSILAVTNARNIHRQLTEIAMRATIGAVPNFRNQNEEANLTAAHSNIIQFTSWQGGSQLSPANSTGEII